MTDHAARLRDAITSNNVHVGIIGLGYVGLPLALAFVAKGIRVTGFDVDPAKPEKLARGESYIKQIGADRIAAMAGSGRFDATTDFSRLGEPDAVLICVPTPLTPQREPDMSYVESSTRRIAACLRPGQLVVLESTTYPGTTDELVRGILEETTPHPARDARASVAGGPAHSVRYRPPEPPRESDVKSDSLNLSASRGEGMGTPGFRGLGWMLSSRGVQ